MLKIIAPTVEIIRSTRINFVDWNAAIVMKMGPAGGDLDTMVKLVGYKKCCGLCFCKSLGHGIFKILHSKMALYHAVQISREHSIFPIPNTQHPFLLKIPLKTKGYLRCDSRGMCILVPIILAGNVIFLSINRFWRQLIVSSLHVCLCHQLCHWHGELWLFFFLLQLSCHVVNCWHVIFLSAFSLPATLCSPPSTFCFLHRLKIQCQKFYYELGNNWEKSF